MCVRHLLRTEEARANGARNRTGEEDDLGRRCARLHTI